MRLEAQVKGGFYPAPPEAVALAADLLRYEGPTAILDPCCGKAAALLQLAAAGSRRPEELYAVELEPNRAAEVHRVLEGAHVLAPCDFMFATATAGSFGMIWLNPPFSDEPGGGGRVEYTFLHRATQLLHRGRGVLVLVCPDYVADGSDIADHLRGHYERATVVPFPREVRGYGEVMVFAVRRHTPVEASRVRPAEFFVPPAGGRYLVPALPGPSRFVKTGLTEGEILEALAKSPLYHVTGAEEEEAAPPPPLELSKGHLALILAGGFLNTTIKREGEEPLLIKATPYKERYLKEERTEYDKGVDENDPTAEATVVQVYSERIKLKIRVAEGDGTIHDLQ